MTTALVSCIIPVFNGERYLAEALDSIVAQTHTAIEVLVVDDGSTDGTAAVATNGRYPVRYFRQANAGPSVARNHGLRESRGAFVAFLDADDRWHPEKLERQLRLCDERPSVAATVAHAVMFHEAGSAPTPGRRPDDVPVPAYISGSLMARRAAFDRVGLFDSALSHADDTSWFLRARTLGVDVALMPDVLLYRRLHDGNMSRARRSESFDEYLRVIKSNLDLRRRGPAT